MYRSPTGQRGVIEILVTVLIVMLVVLLVTSVNCGPAPGTPVREPQPMDDDDVAWDDDDMDDDDDAWDDDDASDDDDDDVGALVLTFSVVVEIPALAGDGERDDDDSAGDDDDSAGDDDDSADDDDSVSDDDDSATDDDDSATDDDDSATDDDDSATDDDDSSDPGLDGWEVSATFRARWSGDAFACETVVSVEGTLFAGEDVAPADCLDCAGLLLFDPSTTTVQDNDCENAPAEPELLVRLLTDPYDEGLGDFLDLALMRADTMEELGIDLAAAGGWAAEDLTEQLAEQDLDFTHAGFVNAFEGSMLDGLGADAVMTPPQDESDRLGFWAFGVHTDEPPPGEEGYPGLLYGVTTFQIAYY